MCSCDGQMQARDGQTSDQIPWTKIFICVSISRPDLVSHSVDDAKPSGRLEIYQTLPEPQNRPSHLSDTLASSYICPHTCCPPLLCPPIFNYRMTCHEAISGLLSQFQFCRISRLILIPQFTHLVVPHTFFCRRCS